MRFSQKKLYIFHNIFLYIDFLYVIFIYYFYILYIFNIKRYIIMLTQSCGQKHSRLLRINERTITASNILDIINLKHIPKEDRDDWRAYIKLCIKCSKAPVSSSKDWKSDYDSIK